MNREFWKGARSEEGRHGSLLGYVDDHWYRPGGWGQHRSEIQRRMGTADVWE